MRKKFCLAMSRNTGLNRKRANTVFSLTHGFTLIELLVVISIIGLLSSIVMVSLKGAMDEGKLAKAKSFYGQVSDVLGADAKAIWKFEESGGTSFADSSGLKQTASCTTCPDSRDANVCGLGFGRCLEFIGTNTDYLTVPSSSTIDNVFYDAATITAWVKPTSLATSFPVVAKSKVVFLPLDIRGYSLTVKATGQVQFGIWTTTDSSENMGSATSAIWETLANVNPVQAGEWFHIAVVFEGKNTANTPAIYINGVRQQATWESVNPHPPSLYVKSEAMVPFWIGRAEYIGISLYANGFIDEVAVYGVGMQAGEIHQLYAQGRENHLANE